MLLVIGDSFAFHLPTHLEPTWRVTCAGWRGARLADESFRTRAIRSAAMSGCRQVLVIIGGNDLARPDFSSTHFMTQFRELELGLLAAGVVHVAILAIPPRVGRRKTDVSCVHYRRRRRSLNLRLRLRYRRPPVQFVPCPAVSEFLGRDGVHPSREGWRAIRLVVYALLSVS